MPILLPGTEVQARGLRWEIVFSQSLGSQTLYRLRGLHGAFKGDEVELLEPFESIQPTYRQLDPERAGPIRNWLLYHQAFLLEQALGPNALLAVQPGRLRLEPYQLVPVLRAIRMSRVRLLLADSVGLGKTIQAGLVITELMARRLAHRILIVSPAGPLLDQWKTEMSERLLANARGYRQAGVCADGGSPLLKPVVARVGDAVTISTDGVRVNGALLPNSAPRTRDTASRPLTPWPFGTYVVMPGTLWVLSSYHPRSFDSRYFGPIAESAVREWLRPLVVVK